MKKQPKVPETTTPRQARNALDVLFGPAKVPKLLEPYRGLRQYQKGWNWIQQLCYFATRK